MDKRIFRASQVEINRQRAFGWIADLNDPQSTTINPDCYWHFDTRKDAARFLALVDAGMSPWRALHEIYPNQ